MPLNCAEGLAQFYNLITNDTFQRMQELLPHFQNKYAVNCGLQSGTA